MNYEKLVRDFAARTRINLDYVNKAARRKRKRPGPIVFETTQLINSMLGLLILPEVAYFDLIPKHLLPELENQGWPHINTVFGSLREDNLQQLMRYLRNGFAHGNIRFLADPTSYEITGLRVWNETSKGIKNWEAEFDIHQLQELVFRFLEIMEQVFETP